MNKGNVWKKIKTEYIGRSYAMLCGILIIVLTLSIIIFLAAKGINTFTKDHYSFTKFIFSSIWNPDAKSPEFGVASFIVTSTIVSLGAVVLSAPIGVALAVFMNLISPKFGEKILQPSLELFVGIPSVVYGWVGVILLVPGLKKISAGTVGDSIIAGILVLSIMILPTIASISSDAIKTIPHDFVEASYGLGATRWQTIYRVIIPASKSGILTGIVLGLARAFGEALAVQMVIGNALRMPHSLKDPATTITSAITMNMGNTTLGTTWNDAIWSLAFLLLIISFIFIVIIRHFGKRSDM